MTANHETGTTAQGEARELLTSLIGDIQTILLERKSVRHQRDNRILTHSEVLERGKQRIEHPETFNIDDADPGTLRLLGTIGLFALTDKKIDRSNTAATAVWWRWNQAMPLLRGVPVNVRSRVKDSIAIGAVKIGGRGDEHIGYVDEASGRISGKHFSTIGEFSLQIDRDRHTKHQNTTRRASYFLAKVLDSNTGEQLIDIEFV